MAELSDTLKHFIDKEISSVHELETLIFLRDNGDRAWTPTEVAACLFGNFKVAAEDLESLTMRGFASCDRTDDLPYYRYLSSKEFDFKVDDLATAYRKFRVKVIGQIFLVEQHR